MMQENVEFQEEYKRLDRLCRDALASDEGVSEYIRRMDRIPPWDRYSVSSWTPDYDLLVKLRWKRNQLAHELPITAELCTQADIDAVRDFYDRMLRTEDPLSLVRRNREEAERLRREEERRKREAEQEAERKKREAAKESPSGEADTGASGKKTSTRRLRLPWHSFREFLEELWAAL